MKKQILIALGSVAAVFSASAQGLVAGWDFGDVLNLGTPTDGYAAEKTNFNNGISTSGALYTNGSFTSTALGSNARFVAAGRAATGVQFGDGFDTTTSQFFAAAATGQQAFEVVNTASDFQFVVGFTSAYDVTVHFDWANTEDSGGSFGDFLNISYSADGANWTAYTPNSGASLAAANSYAAFQNTSAWAASTDASLHALTDGQSNAVIDLTGVTSDEASAIQFVRFEVDAASAAGRIGFDNIHIGGTAVPEPSAFAAIAGVMTLAFVGARRRRK